MLEYTESRLSEGEPFHAVMKSRGFTGQEIAQIVFETLRESAKDLENMEERRPKIHLISELTFGLIQHLSGEGKVDFSNPVVSKTRGIKRDELLRMCIEKAEAKES